MLRNFVFLLLFSWCATSKEIPSYVHLCKRGSPTEVGDCFLKTVYEIMPHLIEGIPEMDIPSIDPLAFNAVKIDTGREGGPVNMVLELGNGTVSGLKNLKLKNIIMHFDKINFTVEIEIPEVILHAAYNIRGKILLFQLNGSGHTNFNATNLKTYGVWTGSTYKKKNKTHINIDNIAFKNVDIENIRVKFEGLFGENEALTENVNNAINENIKSLQGELEPIIKDTLAEIIRDYFNRVYRQFPMDQLYPND